MLDNAALDKIMEMQSTQKMCKTKDCMNVPRQNRSICTKCKSRAYREKYPDREAYRQWRYNSRRRRVPFTITLIQFKEFCAYTNYLQLRGLTADAMTIDCLDNYIGYVYGNPEWRIIGDWSGLVFGNIRMITSSRNASEGKKGKPKSTKQVGNKF